MRPRKGKQPVCLNSMKCVQWRRQRASWRVPLHMSTLHHTQRSEIKTEYYRAKLQMTLESKMTKDLLFVGKSLGGLWLSNHLQCGVISTSKNWNNFSHVFKSLHTCSEVNYEPHSSLTARPHIISLSWVERHKVGVQANKCRARFVVCNFVFKGSYTWGIVMNQGNLMMNVSTWWFHRLVRNP